MTGSAYFKGTSEVAALMRGFDWAANPLGPPGTWPQSLVSIVNLMLNSKQAMCLVWGPSLTLLYNDPYIDVMGAKHPMKFGLPVDEVWEEIWPDIKPILDLSLQGQASLNQNVPLLMHRYGYDEQTWFTFSYSPVYEQDGSIPGMFCVCTDTTQQLLAEKHQSEELEQLRDLFQQAPSVMAVLKGPDHVFEYANKAYLELIGNRDVIGKPLREALPEIESQGFVKLLDDAAKTGVPYIGRNVKVFLNRNNMEELEERYVDFIYQPIKDFKGEIHRIFVEGYDVTESVQATNAMRESELQLNQLVNNLPHLAWMCDKEGVSYWYNDRWYQYTGSSGEQMKGWGWTSVLHPDYVEVVKTTWLESVRTGKPFEITYPLRAANGEYRHFYTLASPLRDVNGNIVRWLGTNTDVTDVQLAQEELRQANQRKDEFLAMLGHELRNPLAPISTSAQLLTLAFDKPETVKKASDIIQRQVIHMSNLLNDLLDVSRVTRGLITLEKQSVNLHQLIEASLEQVRPVLVEKGHTLKLELSGTHPYVEADPIRATQIITNVLHNAIKYTPAQGVIEIFTRENGSNFEIIVRDNGIGIAPNLLPKVFELFSQGARTADRIQGGLGIGLALVKSLVAMHEGTVTIASDGEGKGTVVTLTLPLADQMQPETKPDIKIDSYALKIMIVDDNVDAAETLQMVLSAYGHQVTQFQDPMVALAHATDLNPDICILDIGLPGMDGYAVARELRKIPEISHATFIAITGYGLPQDKDLSRQAGFHHHLVKPIQYDELSAIISGVREINSIAT